MLERTFQDVTHEWRRMCLAMRKTCGTECPLRNIGLLSCENVYYEEIYDKTKEIEEIVMCWAREHPEKKYGWLRNKDGTKTLVESSDDGFSWVTSNCDPEEF